jgi:Protein of unknown function (DUF2961)
MALFDPASTNPAFIDQGLDSRAANFENPTGARGAGGSTYGGRKGAPSRRIAPGERIVLADIEGRGIVRHLWMTFPMGPPEQIRSYVLEVRYDGEANPSVSVPCADFFGLAHGRLVPFSSALQAVQEGRGFNSFIPMPFRSGVRIEFINTSAESTLLYYQVDYTLQAELPVQLGYLHAEFRRSNPTVLGDDFVLTSGLVGPGRYLGCVVGVRTIDGGNWYGEGEIKIFRDGDDVLPTVCGTGLEDYVGTAWGMGAHQAPYGGAPLVVGPTDPVTGRARPIPDFVSFYRWHLLDPIMFSSELEVTLQQIGFAMFVDGQEEEFEAYAISNPPAGRGWTRGPGGGMPAFGLAERVDDVCSTAFVYCTAPQSVQPVDAIAATADVGLLPYEPPIHVILTGALIDLVEAGAEAKPASPPSRS